MPGVIWTLVLAGLYCGIWPLPGSDPLENGFPQEAEGDVHFQVDTARFLEGGKTALEVFLSMPDEAFQAVDDSLRILAAVELLDVEGNSLADFRTEMALPADTPARPVEGFPVPHRWLRLYPRLLDGTRGIRVRVEDLTRLKSGLLDRVRGRHLQGEAQGFLGPAREEEAPPLWLSDLFFVWGPTAQTETAAGEGGLRDLRSRLQPNPHRYYGLHQPVLTVYWEQYLPPEEERGREQVLRPSARSDSATLAGVAPGDRLVSVQRILDMRDSSLVHASVDTVSVQAEPAWHLRRYDLADLPGGTYRFEVSLRRPGPDRSEFAVSSGLFQVIWEESNWTLDQQELLTLGRVLLPARQFEEFEEMRRGEQETYMRNLWNRYAPARPGEKNELEEKFLERARYAADHFREGLRQGILSDRGRIYIRYGSPDEIRNQPNPQDEELLVYALADEVYDDGVTDYEAGRRLSKPRSRSDNSAYVIWEYTLRGDPLLPDYVNHESKVGLKFIFVDELGIGDFRLAYTNAPGVLH